MDASLDDVFELRTIGEAIRALRQRCGVSRDDLAAQAGIAGGTLSRYEADGTLRHSPATVRAIMDALADCLEVDADDLWEQFETWLLDRGRIQANRYLAAQVRAMTRPRQKRRKRSTE